MAPRNHLTRAEDTLTLREAIGVLLSVDIDDMQDCTNGRTVIGWNMTRRGIRPVDLTEWATTANPRPTRSGDALSGALCRALCRPVALSWHRNMSMPGALVAVLDAGGDVAEVWGGTLARQYAESFSAIVADNGGAIPETED